MYIYALLGIALAKNDENLCGTGSGSGQELMEHEEIALAHLEKRQSHLVAGIPGAFENLLPYANMQSELESQVPHGSGVSIKCFNVGRYCWE